MEEEDQDPHSPCGEVERRRSLAKKIRGLAAVDITPPYGKEGRKEGKNAGEEERARDKSVCKCE